MQEDKGGDDKAAEPQYKRVKHAAPRGPTGPRVVWVSRRTRQAHLIKRLSTALLGKNEPLIINALGAAILPAVNLALELNRRWNNGLVLEYATGTVKLNDELQPLADGVDVRMEKRLNSSIRITVTRRRK
jgi:hypothetical protein